MNDIRYKVIFTGEVSANADIDIVKEKVGTYFHLDSEKIDKLFSGGEKTVKKNSTLPECEKIKKAFEKAGAVCEIKAEDQLTVQENIGLHSQKSGPPPLPNPQERERNHNKGKERDRKADEKFCASCGETIKIKSLKCPHCGKKQKKEGMGCLPVTAIVIGIFIVVVAIIGILAAIAIPQFAAYRNRAFEANIRQELNALNVSETVFYEENKRYAANTTELDFAVSNPIVTIEIVNADENCYQAKGETEKSSKIFWIDCNGEITAQSVE